MSPVPRFPWNKGDLPETKKAIKFDQISSCSNSPGNGSAADPACRKLELVRIDQLHTLDTKPTKVRTSQKGPFNANGSGVPWGFEVGRYIYLPYMKTIKKIQAFMWVRHILPVLWDGIGKWKLMEIGPFEWKMYCISYLYIYLKVINPLST